MSYIFFTLCPSCGSRQRLCAVWRAFVVSFGHSTVYGRKPFSQVGGQVRVVCEYVAHGVGTGCDSGFTHSQVFVYFQWIVTVGNVVHHLRIDADIVGCDVSGQLVHLFCPVKYTFSGCGCGVGENRRPPVR